MFKGFAAVAISVMCLFASDTYAEQNYFGGNIGFVDYSEAGISDDASLTFLGGNIGKEFNDYLSAELRFSFGAGSDSVEALGQEVDVKLNRLYGIYLRGGVSASDSFYPYAVIGFSNAKVTASVSGFSASDTGSDSSFGVGAEYRIDEKQALNLEYMSYIDKDGIEISGFSIGFVSYF